MSLHEIDIVGKIFRLRGRSWISFRQIQETNVVVNCLALLLILRISKQGAQCSLLAYNFSPNSNVGAYFYQGRRGLGGDWDGGFHWTRNIRAELIGWILIGGHSYWLRSQSQQIWHYIAYQCFEILKDQLCGRSLRPVATFHSRMWECYHIPLFNSMGQIFKGFEWFCNHFWTLF